MNSRISRQSSSKYSQILELLRLLQQRNRFVGRGDDMPFGLSETHLMVELDIDEGRTPTELSKLLGLNKSNVSRALASLKKRGLLESRSASQETKRSFFTITPKGRRALAVFDRGANERMTAFSAGLSQGEADSLEKYFCLFADGCGVASSALRPSEHPLRREIRRITRALGLLGANFMQSGLSPRQWQILSEIANADGSLIAAELAARLRLAPNTISITLARLKRDTLIETSQSKARGRGSALRLSAAGWRALEAMEVRGGELIARALKFLSAEELSEFISLLSRFAGKTQTGSISFALGEVTLRDLSKAVELDEARTFLLSELVHQGLHSRAPARVIDPGSIIFALSSEGRLCGVCEIERTGSQAKVINLVLSSALATPGNGRALFGALGARCREEFQLGTLSYEQDSYFASLLG